MARLRITDTTLRDAHQSLIATRMRTEHMLPICEKIDRVGYHSLEMWGGATFDSMMRFLDEDPWERVELLRDAMPHTKFQMLLRGGNLVGYRGYPDDVVEAFVAEAVKVGIDIFRVFDALNDERNMSAAMKSVKREGAHLQASISYTLSPVHTTDRYVEFAKTLAAMDADSICIKDMAGLISPQAAFDLVSRLKREVGLPVQLHSHYTSGMASMAYMRGAEAGVDVVDCAISALSMSTSQPATESIVEAMRGTPFDTGLDITLLAEIADYFRRVRRKYSQFEGNLQGVDPQVLVFQIPGGMLSNLDAQLREQGAQDRYDEVLAEVPRVRAELGYPPLVTPTSQIVGTQATLNVITGERYKIVPNEVKQYVRGFYGRPPGEIDPKIRKMILGDEKPLDVRAADLLEPEMPKAREALKLIPHLPRDEVSYALFPQYALDFLKRRAERKKLGRISLEQEVAIIIAALHVESQNVRSTGVRDEMGSMWGHAGRDELMAGRTEAQSTVNWSRAGRREIMRSRLQGGP
ncbi:MAG: pyruvate carboxylase subunit B [Candidatus Thorarchaeota archaeon]|nr:pyruvate carboxylase subunit B [Candidatus Thorarchaeota archaeon]